MASAGSGLGSATGSSGQGTGTSDSITDGDQLGHYQPHEATNTNMFIYSCMSRLFFASHV